MNAPVSDIANGFWRRVDDAVRWHTGVGTLWSGRVVYSDPADHERGSVAPDGTVRLSEEHVVKPLEVLFRKPWQTLTDSELVAARGALKAAVHEWLHLACRAGYTLADRQRDLERDVEQRLYFPIEEGVTEALAHRLVSDIGDRVLPDYLARRINSVQDVRSYPAYAPAAARFADIISVETGESAKDVLTAMVVEPRGSKAAAAAKVLYSHSDLAMQTSDPTARTLAVAALTRSIHQGFVALSDMEHNWPADRVGTSATRGALIADAATETLGRLERKHLHDEANRSSPQAWLVSAAGVVTPPSHEVEGLRRFVDSQIVDSQSTAAATGESATGNGPASGALPARGHRQPGQSLVTNRGPGVGE